MSPAVVVQANMPGTAELIGMESRSAQPHNWDAPLAPAKQCMTDKTDKDCMLEYMAAATDIDTWVAERKGTPHSLLKADKRALAADLRTAARHPWPVLV